MANAIASRIESRNRSLIARLSQERELLNRAEGSEAKRRVELRIARICRLLGIIA
jgi:hypothetical protein